jgi:hypothetical protein
VDAVALFAAERHNVGCVLCSHRPVGNIMTESKQTAKLKLVTVIGPAPLEALIIELIGKEEASGYTLTKAVGLGLHGSRRSGFVDSGNVRVEALVAEEPARRLLAKVAEQRARHHLIAFMVDAEAVPFDHFEP